MDGAFAALIIGTISLGLGGIATAIVLLLFFSSSYFISFVLGNTPVEEDFHQERRDGQQVWANAFWFVVFISIGFYFRDDLMKIVAVGSLAVAMSDTWATELGTRSENKTYFILNFKSVQAGLDGGISLKGSLGGVLGSLLMAIVFTLVSGYHSFAVLGTIVLAGFLGCVLDSYLGAVYQTNKQEVKLPRFFTSPGKLNNDSVNAFATGFGALFTLCMLLII